MAPPSSAPFRYLVRLPRPTQLFCVRAGIATYPGIRREWDSISIELSLPTPRRGAGVLMYVPPCMNRAGGLTSIEGARNIAVAGDNPFSATRPRIGVRGLVRSERLESHSLIVDSFFI